MSTIIVYSQLLWMQKVWILFPLPLAQRISAGTRQESGTEQSNSYCQFLHTDMHRMHCIGVLFSCVSGGSRYSAVLYRSVHAAQRWFVVADAGLSARCWGAEPLFINLVGFLLYFQQGNRKQRKWLGRWWRVLSQAVHARDTIYCLNDREFLVGIIPSSRDSSHSGYSGNFSMRESNTGWLL